MPMGCSSTKANPDIKFPFVPTLIEISKPFQIVMDLRHQRLRRQDDDRLRPVHIFAPTFRSIILTLVRNHLQRIEDWYQIA